MEPQLLIWKFRYITYNVQLNFVILFILLVNIFQLPTAVCPYQYVNYTIMIREQSYEDIMIFGPFIHQGSGRVTQRISSGLNRNQNYSVIVVVDTAVGTSTYFSKI